MLKVASRVMARKFFEGFVAERGWVPPHQRPAKRARGANGALDAHLLNAVFHRSNQGGINSPTGQLSNTASQSPRNVDLLLRLLSSSHTDLHIDEAIAASYDSKCL